MKHQRELTLVMFLENPPVPCPRILGRGDEAARSRNSTYGETGRPSKTPSNVAPIIEEARCYPEYPLESETLFLHVRAKVIPDANSPSQNRPEKLARRQRFEDGERDQASMALFFFFCSTLSSRARLMWGKTPPKAIVARMRVSSSSSPRMAS